MRYKIISPPRHEPVDLASAKDQMRVLHNQEDDLIKSYVAAAREWSEGYTNRFLVRQLIDVYLDDFEDGLTLPYAPIDSVESISYIALDGEVVTLNSNEYRSYPDESGVDIEPVESWPLTAAQREAVTIRCYVGYGEDYQVPHTVKLAIKMLAAHWYVNRESVAAIKLEDVPFGISSLLGHYINVDF